MVEGAPVSLERVLEGQRAAHGRRPRLRPRAASSPPSPHAARWVSSSAAAAASSATSSSCSGASSRSSRSVAASSSLRRAPSASRVETTSASAAAVERPGERSLALSQHARETAGPLDHSLGAGERGREIGLPLGGELVGRPRRVGVELCEGRTEVLLGDPELPLQSLAFEAPLVECRELGPGDVQPDRPQLFGEARVRAGRGSLALERTDLALHLPYQVEQALEVLLGRAETSLGPLTAAAVLQHPGRLFDDRSPVFGARLQDRIEMALADDHVLLAADAGVGEELLDVEQPAGRPVDRVLAVAGAEQGAGDGELGEIRCELPRAVVDGQTDLCPTERRSLRAPGEDDVLHLRGPQRARPLGAEHPRHRVDHVRLATAVRPHHDGDPRLEFEHGRVGERLETFECQRLQEHRPLTLPGGVLQREVLRPEPRSAEIRPGSARRRTSSALRT